LRTSPQLGFQKPPTCYLCLAEPLFGSNVLRDLGLLIVSVAVTSVLLPDAGWASGRALTAEFVEAIQSDFPRPVPFPKIPRFAIFLNQI
jgi:hypothetical protein